MENEVMGIIQSIKTVLDDVMVRMETLEKRQGDIESMIIKEFLDPLKESVDNFNHEEKIAAFKEKCGDKFEPFIEMVKETEGPDYDIYTDLSDSYDAFEENNPGVNKPTEEEFIEASVNLLQAQADKLKAILNADEVEVKSDAEGEIEIVADGEVVADTAEESAEESEATEEPAEEKTKEVIEEKPAEETEDTEDEEDTPEEVAEDYKKLLEEMGK